MGLNGPQNCSLCQMLIFTYTLIDVCFHFLKSQYDYYASHFTLPQTDRGNKWCWFGLLLISTSTSDMFKQGALRQFISCQASHKIILAGIFVLWFYFVLWFCLANVILMLFSAYFRYIFGLNLFIIWIIYVCTTLRIRLVGFRLGGTWHKRYFSGPHKIFVKTNNVTAHLWQVMQVYIKSKQNITKMGVWGLVPNIRNKITSIIGRMYST